MYAISTLLFLVPGKTSLIPKVTYYFSRSLNNFSNFPRCAKCKSLLHGPRNYVDRTCERSANYSARTFSCYRAKPKCNFAVRPLYDRSIMLGRFSQTVWVRFFWRRNKNKIVFENSQKYLRQWSE